MPSVATAEPTPRYARVGDPVWVLRLGRIGTIVELDSPNVVVFFQRGAKRGKFLAKSVFLLDRAPIGEPLWLGWLREVFVA